MSTALSQVVLRHPMLCCCIQDEDSNRPVYACRRSIDLDAHMQFLELTKERPLLRRLEELHDQPWTSQDKTPPWKVVILQGDAQVDEGSPSTMKLDIAFIFHHALADGLSGAAFHASLLEALQDASSVSSPSSLVQDKECTVRVDPNLTLGLPIEKLVKFNLSRSFLLKQVLQEYGPRFLFARKDNHFSGLDCEVSDRLPYVSRIRVLEVGETDVKLLLALCKSQSLSMTSLITASLVNSLSMALPDADAFVGATAYTLRRVSGTAFNVMGNETSGLETAYDGSILRNIRSLYAEGTDSSIMRALWEVAKLHEVGLKSELARCPNNNLVGLLPYVTDYHEFYRKKLGRKREHTFEVSNLGVVGPRGNPTGQWALERAIFAQGAAVVGAALALNCASVLGGSLNITITWQEHIVDEELVEKLVESMDFVLKKAAATGSTKDGDV